VQFPRREIYESTSPVFRFSNCMIDAGGGERRPFPVGKAGRTVFAGNLSACSSSGDVRVDGESTSGCENEPHKQLPPP
jgi:hypothetical protein